MDHRSQLASAQKLEPLLRRCMRGSRGSDVAAAPQKREVMLQLEEATPHKGCTQVDDQKFITSE